MTEVTYLCLECGYSTTDPMDLLVPRDHEMRVSPGEIEPAGECPKCGALVECPDEDIPEHTLEALAGVMRARGWTVVEPKGIR